MSYQMLKADVLFYQRFLKANGFYTDKLDGSWGKKTNEADAAFLAESDRIAKEYGAVDARSEANIITLIPKAQIVARKFLKITMSAGLDVRILSGTRTYAEQDGLYRQGRRNNPGQIVTFARGGQSNHNFGIAWDIGLFEAGKYITNDSKYKPIAPLVMSQLPGIEWGGNWTKLKDYPHYQLIATSESVAVVRGLFESGKVYV